MLSEKKSAGKRKSNDKSKQNRNQQNRQNGTNNNTSVTTKFKGRTTELENHIYDVDVQNQADIFANTTKK